MVKKKEQPQKRTIDMTSDELANSVFPPEVVAQLKQIAHADEKVKNGSNSSLNHDSNSE